MGGAESAGRGKAAAASRLDRSRTVEPLTTLLKVTRHPHTKTRWLHREIGRLFETPADREIFAGLPGTGTRLTPRLLAEWGDDRGRYADAAAVQALAGTAPGPSRAATTRRSTGASPATPRAAGLPFSGALW